MISEFTIVGKLFNFKNNPCTGVLSIHLIKICGLLILPFLVDIINRILVASHFPQIWKRGHVVPLPKLNNPSDLSDLRPIGILSGLSKLLKSFLADQLKNYLNTTT